MWFHHRFIILFSVYTRKRNGMNAFVVITQTCVIINGIFAELLLVVFVDLLLFLFFWFPDRDWLFKESRMLR